MIKFIATDLDGTLLNEKKEVPHDFDEVLAKLHEKGIRFAIASGRQYDTIAEQFKKYIDKIIIIAENGGIVKENGKTLFCDPMPGEDARKILADALNEDGLYPIVCGRSGAFGNADNSVHEDDVAMYYAAYRTVDDVEGNIGKDDILKIAVYDEKNAGEHCYNILKKYEKNCGVFVSGEHWTDVMKKGVTKGTAIEKIQKIYGFKPCECMAFGDFMNDADMMRVCDFSYAMENACDDLKKLCRYSAPSNENDGVTQVIRELVL